MTRAATIMLALCAALAGCSTAPRGPSAEVQASCPPLEAMPERTDVAALYRACREAVLHTGQPAQPADMPRLCPPRPGASAAGLGPWAEACP